MKKIDKKDLKKVSGGMKWCTDYGSYKNGKTYYLDNEARETLKANGYNVKMTGWTIRPETFRMGMSSFYVTDAAGNGIGDAAMQNLLGAPIPHP